MADFNNLTDQFLIVDRNDLTPTERLVALILLSFRNSETGRCNPPIFSDDPEKKTICSRTGFTRQCVIKTLSSLEQKKIIVCKKQNARPSEITFTVNNNYCKQELPSTTFTDTVNEDYRTVNNDYRSSKRRLPITKKEQRINKESNKEDGGETLTSPTSENDCCKSKKQNNRGTSFNLETIPEDWKNVAEQLDPDLDPEKLFEEFADYWRAVPGERGRKKDWLATFRNHIRNLPDWKRKNFRKTNCYREPETREPDFSKIDYGESGLLSDFKF